MAIVTNFTMKLKAEGLNEGVQKAAALRKELEAAGAASARINVNIASQGKGGKAAIKSAEDAEELSAYGKARASVGTGAAGRDFAKQAQGLGGLVHVYATFAANIFAVGAAFTALSKAMDTTNMIRGLDQVGAASGRALGSLAMQVERATHGAVSLRDSLESVAKASSAGMSSKQILEMSEVATKASQALGVNMADAMSRMTRGIAKLEPELLDELGIMTKVGKATEDYAKSVGKATSALTDFERRQAFANAVLEEGKKKFDEIQIDPNPYQKLLASMQNVLQTGLEVVNKVFVPIVSYLSESPTALATVMAGIVGMLVKQALPAIGAMRENAAAAADAAGRVADARVKSAEQAIARITAIESAAVHQRMQTQLAALNAEADAKVAAFDAAEERLKTLRTSKSGKGSAKILTELEGVPSRDITEKQLAQLDKLGNRTTAVAASYRELAKTIRASQAAELEFEKKQREVDDFKNSAAEREKQQVADIANSNAAVRRQIELRDKAEAARVQRVLKSNAIESTQVLGARIAYAELTNSIKAARDAGQLTGMQAAWTKVTGTVGIATQAVMGFAGALSNILGVIGIVTVVFQMLDSKFSKNSEQMSKFNSDLKIVSSSVANLGRTIEQISKKGFGKTFDIDSLNASANAFNDLSDSIERVSNSFAEMDKAASSWDRFWDGVKDAFGEGSRDKLRDSVSNSVVNTISALEAGPARDAYIAKIKEIFAVDTVTVQSIGNIFDNTTDPEVVKRFAAAVSTANKAISTELSNTASKAKSAKDAIEGSATASRDLLNSFKDNSKLSQFADSLFESGSQLKISLTDAKAGAAALLSILEDSSRLSLLPPDVQEDLRGAKDELNRLTRASDAYSKKTKEGYDAELKVVELRKQQRNLGARSAQGRAIQQEIDQLLKLVEAGKNSKALKIKVDADISALQSKLGKTVVSSFIGNAIDLAGRALELAIEKASLKLRAAIGAYATGIGKVEIDTRLKLREFDLQERSIKAMYDLGNEIAKNALVEQKRSAEADGRPQDAALAQEQLDFRSKGVTATLGDFKKLSDAAASALFGYFRQLRGVQAELAEIQFGRSATNFDKTQKLEAENLAIMLRQRDVAAQVNQLTSARLGIINGALGGQSELLLAAQNEEASAARTIQNLRAREAQEGKIAEIIRARQAAITAEDAASLARSQRDQEAELANILQLQLLQEQNEALQHAISVINTRVAIQKSALELYTQESALQSQLVEQQLDAAKQELDYAVMIGAVKKEQQISAQERLDLANLEVKAQAAIAAIEAENAATALDFAAKRQAIMADTSMSSSVRAKELSRLAAEEARVNKIYSSRIALTKSQQTAQAKNIKLIAEETKYLSKMESLVESLATVFGDVGKNVGEGFAKLVSATKATVAARAKIDEDYAKKKEALDENGFLKLNDYIEADRKLTEEANKERTKLDIDYYATSAGAAKGMFDEKTAAHRLFSGIEKAMHLAKMAMMATELAAELSSVGTTVAAEGAKSAAKGKGAILSALSAPFPINFAAGALMAAIVASILGGGSSVANISGLTAKDRQSTQGTGTTWQDGKKVETGGGVFGDSEAKSESIVKSLELISATSVEGLSNSKDMLNALKGIQDAVSGTAKALYSVTGLRIGSSFGTAESVKTSGISGLFGKTTSKEIIDSGLKIAGSFKELADGISGTIKQYEVLQTTTKKSGFLGIGSSTKTSISESFKNADQQIVDSIATIFSNATTAFQKVGAKLGMSAEDVLGKLGNINVSAIASLRDLKGEELEEEFGAIIGSILDSASETLFASMKKYQQFGEGMLETVVRVVDANDKIKLSMDSISKTYTNLGFEASEALVELAGGLDKFLDSVEEYKDTFLTDAEKLAPIQQSVSNTMRELGYSTVDTRAEFKALVNSIDITTETGQKLFTSLMEVSGAFATVTEAHQALIDDYTSLELELLATIRGNAEAKQLIQDKETAGLSALAKEQYLVNKATQEQIDALEEHYSLMDQLDSTLMSSTELRAKERSEIHATNLALFDYLNAVEDKKKAEADMADSLETIRSIMDQLATAAKDSSEELSVALENIVTGFSDAKDKLSAAETELSSVLDNIVSGYNSAKDAVASAQAAVQSSLQSIVDGFNSAASRLASARTSLSNTLNSIVSGFTSAKAALASADAGVKSSLDKITSGYVNAMSGVQSAQQSITNKYIEASGKLEDAKANTAAALRAVEQAMADAARAAADALRNLSSNIKKFLQDLQTNALSVASGPEKFKLLRNQFNALAESARMGDTKALEQITDAAQGLLEAGQAQAGSSLEYAELFGMVTGTLSSLSSAIDTKVGPEDTTDDSQNSAIAALAAAQAAQSNAEQVLAKWAEVAESAGLKLENLVKDPDQEYKDALAAYVKATEALTSWTDALEQSGAALSNNEDPATNALLEYFAAKEDREQKLADLTTWQNLISANNIDIVANTKTSSDTIGQYFTEWKAAQEEVRAAEADSLLWQSQLIANNIDIAANTKTSAEVISKYFSDWKSAQLALASAEGTLSTWEQLLAANNISIAGSTKSTAETVGKYFEDWKLAQAKVDSAAQEVAVWQQLMQENGINVSDGVKSTADTVAAYFDAWKAAKLANDKAQADLATAQALLPDAIKNALAVEVDQFTALKEAIKTYSDASDLLASANTVLTNNKLEDIRAAIDAVTSAIVAAAKEPPAPAVVEKDLTKLPEVPPPRQALDEVGPPKILANPLPTTSSFMRPSDWYAQNEGALNAAQYQSNESILSRLRRSYQELVGSLPSFDIGTDYVPEDMVARIHKGERITPAKYNNNADNQLLQEVKLLRQEIATMKQHSEQTASNTKKTKDIIEQVTLGGQYMQTKEVT